MPFSRGHTEKEKSTSTMMRTGLWATMWVSALAAVSFDVEQKPVFKTAPPLCSSFDSARDNGHYLILLSPSLYPLL